VLSWRSVDVRRVCQCRGTIFHNNVRHAHLGVPETGNVRDISARGHAADRSCGSVGWLRRCKAGHGVDLNDYCGKNLGFEVYIWPSELDVESQFSINARVTTDARIR
jgi:hypothetical protein